MTVYLRPKLKTVYLRSKLKNIASHCRGGRSFLVSALAAFTGFLLLSLALNIQADNLADDDEVYLSRDDFLAKSFAGVDGDSPQAFKSKTFWLNKNIKTSLLEEFDYRFSSLRARYWQKGERTAWILEEVGKDRPITFGLVVDQQKVYSVDVLVYRESRGGEIRYPFFTKQFESASLLNPPKSLFNNDVSSKSNGSPKLDVSIDGITGATLSVRASKKVVKVALLFDQLRRAKEQAR